jgi:hypothetical protein
VEEDLFHKESESKVAKIWRLNKFLVQEGFQDPVGVRGVGGVGGNFGQGSERARGGRLFMDCLKVWRCHVCGHERVIKDRDFLIDFVYHKARSPNLRLIV